MSASEFAGLGLAPGVVRGARSFKVDGLGRLTGIHYPQVWRPGENAAECRAEVDPYASKFTSMSAAIDAITRAYSSYPPLVRMPTSRVVPTLPLAYPSEGVVEQASYEVAEHEVEIVEHSMPDCSCGFYAYYDGSDDYYKAGLVSGVVEGYGETLIGTRGFRCMKARIVALMIPAEQDRFASRIARNYAGVPLFTRFTDMVAEFPPDGGEVGVSPDGDDFWTRSI